MDAVGGRLRRRLAYSYMIRRRRRLAPARGAYAVAYVVAYVVAVAYRQWIWKKALLILFAYSNAKIVPLKFLSFCMVHPIASYY